MTSRSYSHGSLVPVLVVFSAATVVATFGCTSDPGGSGNDAASSHDAAGGSGGAAGAAGSGGGGSGGGQAGNSDGGAVGAACDPVAQDCSGTLRCNMDCGSGPNIVVACIDGLSGTGQQGTTCTRHRDCAKNLTCAATNSGTSLCLQFCNSTTTCPSGTTCIVDVKFVCKQGDTVAAKLSLCAPAGTLSP